MNKLRKIFILTNKIISSLKGKESFQFIKNKLKKNIKNYDYNNNEIDKVSKNLEAIEKIKNKTSIISLLVNENSIEIEIKDMSFLDAGQKEILKKYFKQIIKII